MILMCGLNATLVVTNTIYIVQAFSIKQKINGKSILTIYNLNVLNAKGPLKGVRNSYSVGSRTPVTLKHFAIVVYTSSRLILIVIC